MQALTEQAPALIGVLLGALSTIIATYVSDRSRWRRTQSVRWDERRLAAYTEYSRALKDVYHIASRLAVGRVPTLMVAGLERDAGIELLNEAEGQRTKAWESILLLGDPATVQAAREWREAVWRMERIAVDLALGSIEWDEAVPSVDQARDRFYQAARASLEISSGPVAQALWLSSNAPWLRLRSQSAAETDAGAGATAPGEKSSPRGARQ